MARQRAAGKPSKIVLDGALYAMQESITATSGRLQGFEARVYSPYEDDGDRYAEYDAEASNQGLAFEALTDTMSGVFFPDFGDRLLSFTWLDDPRD